MISDQVRRREYEKALGLRPGQPIEDFVPGRPNPGIGWTWIINILISLLAVIIPAISPVLRERLEKFLLEFYHDAMETDRAWDDFLARFLLRIFGIPVPT